MNTEPPCETASCDELLLLLTCGNGRRDRSTGDNPPVLRPLPSSSQPCREPLHPLCCLMRDSSGTCVTTGSSSGDPKSSRCSSPMPAATWPPDQRFGQRWWWELIHACRCRTHDTSALLAALRLLPRLRRQQIQRGTDGVKQQCRGSPAVQTKRPPYARNRSPRLCQAV